MARNTLIDPVLENGYNVRLRRDDFAAVVGSWTERSVALRARIDATLDHAYDTGERDKLDLFRCGQTNAPLFVFIHGGYWQRGDKSIYSFIAEPFLASGADVALIGYELCPTVDIPAIVTKMRRAIAWLWQNAADIGVSQHRINVSGHSAGGHLIAMLLTTNWNEIDGGIPPDVIKSTIPISGLYQLEPLRRTTIGELLHLTEQATRENSPHFLRPAAAVATLVALGGAETPQFHWQTDAFIGEWRRHGMELAYHAEPHADHFDIVDRLADAGSAIFRKTRGWLR